MPAEVAADVRHIKARKSVPGSLPPWFLKAAANVLAPALSAQFNAWVRVGQLADADALFIINLLPKPGAQAGSCDSLRGIAVGTLAVKLFAMILERRLSDWAEANGSRAAGQFGFRRRRSTAQAALALRTLQNQHRSDGQQLWACFVDFKKAYDTVPRQRLWDQLAARGLGSSWLRVVQALCANVPMSVRTADGLSPCFQPAWRQAGLPLSPTLFGLYIDDFEAEVLAAARRGKLLDLPALAGSYSWVHPLVYADDMVLLATSAAWLQRQLGMLQQYCQRWGLTVNTVKTELLLLSGERTQQAAVRTAERARLSFGGASLAVVPSFKYLCITFHGSFGLAGAAAPARVAAARAAMHSCRARSAALGIEAAPVQLQLFSTMVDSVLSYGAEVWGMQLAAKAAAWQHRLCSGHAPPRQPAAASRCAARHAQRGCAGRMRRALWLRWVMRAARLWNHALAADQGSLLRQTVTASAALALAPGSRRLAQRTICSAGLGSYVPIVVELQHGHSGTGGGGVTVGAVQVGWCTRGDGTAGAAQTAHACALCRQCCTMPAAQWCTAGLDASGPQICCALVGSGAHGRRRPKVCWPQRRSRLRQHARCT